MVATGLTATNAVSATTTVLSEISFHFRDHVYRDIQRLSLKRPFVRAIYAGNKRGGTFVCRPHLQLCECTLRATFRHVYIVEVTP
jgi:hypothetical protein